MHDCLIALFLETPLREAAKKDLNGKVIKKKTFFAASLNNYLDHKNHRGVGGAPCPRPCTPRTRSLPRPTLYRYSFVPISVAVVLVVPAYVVFACD